MEEQVKINKLARDFGVSLMATGGSLVRGSIKNPTYIMVGFGTLKTNLVNAGVEIPTGMVDYQYQTATWPIWEEALAQIHTILGKTKWTKEVYDCDDFARTKKALTAWLFGLTDMGNTYGEVFDRDTGISEGKHYFNIIITSDNKAYCHEAITGESILIEKDKPIVLGGWKYQPISIRF